MSYLKKKKTRITALCTRNGSNTHLAPGVTWRFVIWGSSDPSAAWGRLVSGDQAAWGSWSSGCPWSPQPPRPPPHSQLPAQWSPAQQVCLGSGIDLPTLDPVTRIASFLNLAFCSLVLGLEKAVFRLFVSPPSTVVFVATRRHRGGKQCARACCRPPSHADFNSGTAFTA